MKLMIKITILCPGRLYLDLLGPFAKFVDSPYHSESELCGGAVTVSFSKYLPWQAMHFLQHSTHFSKTCCRPLITSKFLASELPFHGWKSPEIAWDEIWIEFCVRLGNVYRWNPIRTSAIQSIHQFAQVSRDPVTGWLRLANSEGREGGDLSQL
jgi:hypothetical protein